MPFGKSATSSLSVAGSAAHMHSRDYIEIINVVYKDEFDGCCGKDHNSPPHLGNEPLLRKTWMMKPNNKAATSCEKDEKNRKPPRIYSSSSIRNRQRQSHGRPNSFLNDRTKAQNLLPDIPSSKLQKNPKPEKCSKHTTSDLGLQGVPKDNFICSCKEGLVYLKKTYEWQNLLGEYRDEILKLRENLKEREKIEERRGRFKRSTTIEQKKDISELFKEYRSNSYQLLRMRMEERIRHEHKVFEKLSRKTQSLHINSHGDSSSQYSDNFRPKQSEASSRSPTPPSSTSSEEVVHKGRKPTEKQKSLALRKPQTTRERDRFVRASSMKLSPKLPTQKKLVHSRQNIITSDSDDEELGNVDVSVKRFGSSGIQRPQRVVVRKKVVRCPCLNH